MVFDIGLRMKFVNGMLKIYINLDSFEMLNCLFLYLLFTDESNC